jgi:hypothetical protein
MKIVHFNGWVGEVGWRARSPLPDCKAEAEACSGVFPYCRATLTRTDELEVESPLPIRTELGCTRKLGHEGVHVLGVQRNWWDGPTGPGVFLRWSEEP